MNTDHGCGGTCNQGRAPCDCELSLDVHPDADRVIQPPIPEPEPNYRARAHYMALAVVAAVYLGLALLLKLCGSRSFGA